MKTLYLPVITLLLASLGPNLLGSTLYVSAGGTNATPPYADWSTAATNIQDAIDAASDGDLILVTNGLYATGGGRSMDGASSNRVTLDKAVTVQSVNGPLVTTIEGVQIFKQPGSLRCAWLTNNAVLSGFRLLHGATAPSGPTAAQSGGGVWCASSNAVVANCLIVSNAAANQGGGAYQGSIENSLISSNNAQVGGAAYGGSLRNCTVVNNNSGVVLQSSAGMFSATNCILLGANAYSSGRLGYCCASPMPAGAGNFTNDPMLFVDNAHLRPGSPCIGAGTNVATGTDLFGQAWADPPSVGCAEYFPTPALTPPQFSFSGPPARVFVSVATGGPGPASFQWLKDGEAVTDGAQFSGSQTTNIAVLLTPDASGAYQLAASNAFGATTSVVAGLVVHCVNLSNTNPAAPYLTWAGAATNIQDAIKASSAGDVVLVTNGVYGFPTPAQTAGGTMTNTVTIDRAVSVISVNGPFETFIEGGSWNYGDFCARCAWLTNNAALVGFTLRWGHATVSNGQPGAGEGGGAWGASASALIGNCVLASNVASTYGGGVFQCTVRNSFIYSNSVNGVSGGGGAAFAALYNSTVVSNAQGGLNNGTATNCIFYPAAGGVIGGNAKVGYSCNPVAVAGAGNITNAPLFLPDGIHLQNNSPGAGAGADVASGLDLFGQAWNNPPSMGCAEVSSLPTVTTPRLQLTFSPPGFAVGNAAIGGATPDAVWWIKDGEPLADDGHFSGTQSALLTANGVGFGDAGSYQLVVSNNFGVVTSAVAALVAHCVDAGGTNAVAPYTSWGAAATNIQDAIDAAAAGEVVLVTNGVYTGGGKSEDGVITNRVSIDKPIIVQSVNGAFATTIQGAWDPATNGPLAVRCAWLTTNAGLSGFTLAGGATRSGSGITAPVEGGGLYGAGSNSFAFDCVFTNNFAEYGAGAANATINNSFFAGNCAIFNGGGAYAVVLNNCTVVHNFSAQVLQSIQHWGAGTYGCLVRNSIVEFNSDLFPFGLGSDDYAASPSFPLTQSFYHSCTESLLSGGGSVTFDAATIFASPELVNWLRITTNSPCRGAAGPADAVGVDIFGQGWANPPSMGCAEVVPAELIGPLSVILTSSTNTVAVSTTSSLHPVSLVARVSGLASATAWSFGDGPPTNSDFSIAHFWTNAGIYPVTFTAFNADHPEGASAMVVIRVGTVPIPVPGPPALTNNTAQFAFTAQANIHYVVQYATNLSAPILWQTLETIDVPNSQSATVIDTNGVGRARFYRILAH